MSLELQKLRGELLREALLKGWTKPADVQQPWPQQVPRERIERWYRKLYKSAEEPLPVGQRLINHFMVGADPEFVFHDGLQRMDARQLSLKAGPAFGADNNGRLCELRPHPSRSALSVLASMWLAMRWMAVWHPQTLAYNWRSGAYFESDGLGGHVHFGRKRPKFREREVSALDRITHLQFQAGIFDREEGRLRVRQAQGAPTGQPYGALGDVRLQPHGYEYRTLPSWVDGPWLAYFNLVCTKLVVALPDLVAPLSEADASIAPEQARGQLRMLLAYYSAQDDDARLALAILARRGWPAHASGLDFKANWGLFANGPLGSKPETSAPAVMPESIPPTEAEEQELASAMFENRAPELTPLKPTWPSNLPEGYVQAIRYVDTKLAPGLGEFCMPLAMHKDHPVQFTNSGHGKKAFRFPASSQPAGLSSGLFRALEALGLSGDCALEDGNIQVNASKDFTLAQLLKGRECILRSRVFPLWSLDEVKAGSYQEWYAGQSKPHVPREPKVLFHGQRT